jgi:uncharacterized membrane protein YfcA
VSGALLVALLAAVLAGAVAGLTGFGLALISTPILLFAYEPRTVVAVTAVLSIFINVAVVWDSWREAYTRLALFLLVPATAGIFAGAAVLGAVDPDLLRIGVGVLVVVSALLLVREVRLPAADTSYGAAAAGAASGFLSTSTGLAGPPVVMLLVARRLPKHAFRATTAFYFLPMSVIAAVVLYWQGLVREGEIPLALVLVPVAVLGKWLGTRLLERVSEDAFRLLALGLTAATGVLGVTTAAWAFL